MTTPRTLSLLSLSATLLLGSLASTAHAEERLLRRHVRTDDGAATVAAGEGEKGAIVRGRRTHVDEEGNVVTGRGALLRGANGGTAARAGRITRSPDGSVSHQGGFAANGEQGSIKSQGEITRSATGDVNGERQTTATGAQGNTYQGTTTYSKGEGIEHSATCTDAAGNAIACKR
jgi:hypothetical protein